MNNLSTEWIIYKNLFVFIVFISFEIIKKKN